MNRRSVSGRGAGAAPIGLEIEIGVVRGRRQAADAVVEQRPERGPRLDPAVPVPRRAVFRPVDLAHVVEDRDRRRRGQVGIGDAGSGQPVARAGQPVGVFEVLLDVGARRADRRRIGRAAALRRRHLRLEDALADQVAGHLAVGLDQIPVAQPADLGAADRILDEQALVALQHAAGLVDIFGDDARADDRHVALRQSTGKVAAGLSVRNSLRRAQGFSSISSSSSPYSAKASLTKRLAALIGWWNSVSMEPFCALRRGCGMPRRGTGILESGRLSLRHPSGSGFVPTYTGSTLR